MAERVEIRFEATDAMSGVMRGVLGQFGQFGNLIGSLTEGQIRWGNVAADAASLVVRGFNDSVKAAQQYASQVRDLSAVSGQSAEETSRFIQVLDDYELTVDDARTATRTLTKEGLTPSIATLAKLSDEYLSLNDAQKQNELILKNLGRSGLGWVNLLKQGSAAIRENAANVSQSLILGQQQLDQAEELRLAQDEWQDTIEGLKVSIGTGFVTAMVDAIHSQEDYTRAGELATEMGKQWWMLTKEQKDALVAQAGAEREAAQATKIRENSIRDAAKADEEAIKAITEHNKTLLSTLESAQSAQQSYADKVQELGTERAELEAKKAELISQGYSQEGADIMEINKKLDENAAKAKANADEHEMAGRRIVFSLLTQRLMVDGLTQQETDFLLKTGESWGIYSSEVVTWAQKAMGGVDNYVDALNRIPTNITTELVLKGEVFSRGIAGRIGGRQHGGMASGLVPVGERGMELVQLPGGSRVYSNSQSRQMLSTAGNKAGGNITVIYNAAMDGADERMVAQRLEPALLVIARKYGWGN